MEQADFVSPDEPITAMEFRPITSAVEDGWLTVSIVRIVIHAENGFDKEHERFVDVELEPPHGKEILLAIPASDHGPAVGERPANTITINDLSKNLDYLRNRLQ